MVQDKTTSAIILMAVTFFLAIAFLNSISTQVLEHTQKAVASGETTNLSVFCYTPAGQVNESNLNCNITVKNAPSGWKIENDDCNAIGNVVVTNATGSVLTLNTDYRLYATQGLIQMLNTTATNSTNLGENVIISYDYCGDGYVTSSWGRSLLNTTTGFFALGILLAIVGLVYILYNKRL